MRKLNFQQIINITLTTIFFGIFIILMAIPMRLSILRMASASKDAGIQFANEFTGLVDKKKLLPDTLLKIPDYKKYLYKKDKKNNQINDNVSREENGHQIKEDNNKYWKNFKEKKNIIEYTFKWMTGLTYFLQAIMVLVVIVLLLKMILREYFKRQKVAPYEKSKQLQKYQISEKTIIYPIIPVFRKVH